MTEGHREKFLRRISSVGWGTRDSVQMLVGALVSSIREEVADGRVAEEDVPIVAAFHDQAEEYWRATLATNPPMPPDEMVIGLDHLCHMCVGPLAGYRVQLDRARANADMFARQRTQRERSEAPPSLD